jgi:hypothetical protein
LSLPNFIFIVSRVEVCQELIFHSNQNEGVSAVTSVVVIMLDFNREISLLILSCTIPRSEKFLVAAVSLGCFFSFLRESVSQDKISILCFPFVQECALVFSLTGAGLSPHTRLADPSRFVDCTMF